MLRLVIGSHTCWHVDEFGPKRDFPTTQKIEFINI